MALVTLCLGQGMSVGVSEGTQFLCPGRTTKILAGKQVKDERRDRRLMMPTHTSYFKSKCYCSILINDLFTLTKYHGVHTCHTKDSENKEKCETVLAPSPMGFPVSGQVEMV